MKLLWLNGALPLPLDKGGNLRTWHIMRHVATRHDITYLSFADPSQPRAYREGMREVCARLETVPRVDQKKGTWRFYADAAGYIVNPVPYAVAKYRSAAYRARLEHLLATEGFDVVVSDFLVPVVNLPASLPCHSVVFTHNVEADLWRRYAQTATNPVARRLLMQQWQRMLRFEARALARFDVVLAVSDADRQTFQRLYPTSLCGPVRVIQTGVDTSYFHPSSTPPDRAHLVFTGSMDWLPNEDAMLWFCREILPRLRAQEPGITLSIVGRSPTPAVRKLAALAGVEVTGRVDDVRPHVAQASVYVVPLRIGGGTRLKIFEAMSMGKAVVSTAVGAEGLPVTSGKDIIIADDPETFANAVVRLIRNSEERRAIEEAARRLVVEHYDWSAVAHGFEDALLNLTGRDVARGIA